MAVRHRYLVTGAQGFVGHYLIHCLLSRTEESTILGIGRSSQRDSHFLRPLTCTAKEGVPLPEPLRSLRSPRYSYLSVDLLSDKLLEVVRQFRPTAVIHLAALLRGVSDELILLNNAQSTESLLKTLLTSESKPEMFLLASSGGVYGRQYVQPISEFAELAPMDDYAKSKLAAESMVQRFAERSGTRVAVARIFNVLGPGQDELHLGGRLVAQIGAILSRTSPEVIRVGSLGSTRDFLDVRDVSTALALILEHNREGIYNVGSGVETRIADLVKLFLESAELQDVARIENNPDVIDYIPRHVASVQRIAAIGFKPTRQLALTCCEMLECYRLLHGQDKLLSVEDSALIG
ncbi:MAG: NAD(P)-dependent oxidoreductase [Polyangiaceae bacterium]|nr:NAD(P)-dependent oxidoreductase [Polyangiaceae bacterium]